MKQTKLPIRMIGKTGKTINYTANIVNGKFVSMVKHGTKKDINVTYEYGKRVYQNREKFYLSETRGHAEELPVRVPRYRKEPPVYRKPRLIPKHKKVSAVTRERRTVRETILKVIQDIRSCTYRLAQHVFKTVLRPFAAEVKSNPQAQLYKIDEVVQFSNSSLFLVFEAPDYDPEIEDKECDAVSPPDVFYFKVNPDFYTYKDIILGTCLWDDLQEYLTKWGTPDMGEALLKGLVGLKPKEDR